MRLRDSGIDRVAIDRRPWPGQRIGQSAYWATLVLMGMFTLFLVVDAQRYNEFSREDGLVETVGFLFLLATAVLLLKTGWRVVREPRGGWLPGLMLLVAGLGFLFGAGEEISWGQRILGIETPATLKEINHQGETNLHNIHKGLVDQSVRYGIALFALCCALSTLLSIRRLIGLPLPPPAIVHAYALQGIYQKTEFLDRPYYLSSAVLILLLIVALRDKSVPRRLWMPCLSIGVAVAITLLHSGMDAEIGLNSTPEVRELLFAITSCSYAACIGLAFRSRAD